MEACIAKVFFVDIEIKHPSHGNILLEIDGSIHETSLTKKIVDNRKTEILNAMGYTNIIRITNDEWNKLGNTLDAQCNFLTNKINEVDINIKPKIDRTSLLKAAKILAKKSDYKSIKLMINDKSDSFDTIKYSIVLNALPIVSKNDRTDIEEELLKVMLNKMKSLIDQFDVEGLVNVFCICPKVFKRREAGYVPKCLKNRICNLNQDERVHFDLRMKEEIERMKSS